MLGTRGKSHASRLAAVLLAGFFLFAGFAAAGWMPSPVFTGSAQSGGACDAVSETYGYTCATITGTFEDIRRSGTTVSGMGFDDAVSSAIDITVGGNYPAFHFYGVAYDAIQVSTNGFLLFGDDHTSAGSGAPVGIPTAGGLDRFAAPLGADYDMTMGGSIHYAVESTGGHHLIVQWTDVPQKNEERVTFQAKLWYNTSVVEFAYFDDVTNPDTRVVGIEDHTGTSGLEWLHGATPLLQVPGSLESTDTVYLASTRLKDRNVEALDLRLTDFGSWGAGALVDANANDLDLPTDSDLPHAACYLDANENAELDLGDTVYLTTSTSRCSSVRENDVRLTEYSSFGGGSMVGGKDADVGMLLNAVPAKSVPIYDHDGNRALSAGDAVYLDANGDGTVSLNDVRLTGSGSFGPFTFVRSGDRDLQSVLVSAGFALGATDGAKFAVPDLYAPIFTPPAVHAPSPPQDLTLFAGTSWVNLSWQPPADTGMDDVAYTIWRGTDNRTESLSMLGSTTLTHASDFGVIEGTTYFYAIAATNSAGSSDLSEVRSARTGDPSRLTLFFDRFDDGLSPAWTTTGFWRVTGECPADSPGGFHLSFNQPSAKTGCDYGDGVIGTGYAARTIDLTTYSDALLSFDHYWVTENNANPRDLMQIQVIEAGSNVAVPVSWDSSVPNKPYWSQVDVDLTPYVGQVIELRFHFDSVDGLDNIYDGWSVDNVAVTVDPLPSLPRDIQAVAGPGRGELTYSWQEPLYEGASPITQYRLNNKPSCGSLAADFYATTTATSYVVGGLGDGVTDCWAVAADNDHGTSGLSAYVAGTTYSTPSAPLDLSAAAGPGIGEISLSWAPPADDGQGVTHYDVYSSADATGPFTFLANVSSPGFVDTGLGADEIRYYEVTAVNPAGASNPASTTGTTFSPPSPPQDVAAAPGPTADGIQVTWSPPLDDGGRPVVYYLVDRSPDNSTFSLHAETTDLWFNDTGLGPAETWYYRVRAVNDVGTSDPSASVDATSFDVPSPPTSPDATAGPDPGMIRVSWQPPLDDGGRPVLGYSVARASDGVTFTHLANTTDLFYDDVGLGDGETLTYRVRAFNDVGTGTASAGVSATTFDVPSAPQSPSATAGPGVGELTVAWAAPEDDGGDTVTGYDVYRSADGVQFLLHASVLSSPFTDTGLAAGATWFYEVRAVNSVGSGAPSAVVSATTFDVPGVPQDVNATAGPDAGAIWLTWSGPADDGGTAVTGYDVFRSGDGTDYTLIATTALLSYNDTGLGDGTTWWYRVLATNAVGDGPLSVADSATTFTVPSKPIDFTAESGPGVGEITLTWGPPLDDGGTPLTRYVIESTDANGLVSTTTVGPDATSFPHRDLESGATYTYSIYASNLIGDGPAAPTVQATTFDAPSGVTGVTVSAGPTIGDLTVAWSAPLDDGGQPIDGYRVFAGNTSGDWDRVFLMDENQTQVVDTGHSPGTTRHYLIEAHNAVGYGDSVLANGTTDPLPAPPVDVLARSGPNRGQVSVSWSPPLDDGGWQVHTYQVYGGGALDDLSPLVSIAADPAKTRYSWAESGLGDDVLRFYAISAITAVGEGATSETAYASSYTVSSSPEPLPTNRTLTSASWDGTHAYIFGGIAGDPATGPSIDEIVRFDPSLQETTLLDVRLPADRYGTSAAYAPEVGEIFIFGGDHRSMQNASSNGDDEFSVSGCHPACYVSDKITGFDPSTESVRDLAETLPRAVWGTAAAYVPVEMNTDGMSLTSTGGSIYIFGGQHVHEEEAATEDFEVQGCHPACMAGEQIVLFDAATEQTTDLGNLISGGRFGMSAQWVPSISDDSPLGLVYLFGGHPEETSTAEVDPAGCHPACHVGMEILVFDPYHESVSLHATTLPSERWFTSAGWDGTYVYIIGGENETGHLDEILRFDPVTGDIAVVGHLPSPRGGTSAVSAGDSIYVFGGDDGNDTTDEVVRFRPTAPTQTTAEAGSGPRRITISWEPPANAALADITGYRLYASKQSDAQVVLATLPATARQFVHDKLGTNEAWFYKVSAISAVGESPQSDEVMARTFGPPSAPRSIQAEPDAVSRSVFVSWEPPADDGGMAISKYWLWRESFPVGGTTLIYSGTDPYHADDSCLIGTTCTYRVRAISPAGYGPYSEEASAAGTALPLV